MPWSNQGGGPWSQRPGGGPRPGGSGPQPPNVEEILRRGQDRLKDFLPGNIGGGRAIGLIVLGILALWLLTGFYRVDTAEQGVELMFGRWTGATTAPGLHYWFPSPIGAVLTPNVEEINRVDVGFRSLGNSTPEKSNVRDVPRESLMLTADQNIANADFSVLWRVKDAGAYLFNIRRPEESVKIVAESAMREVVGQTNLQDLLTSGRRQVEQRTQNLLQEILDEYGAGIIVQNVQLLQADPPEQVVDAFNEVQRARQDKVRLQNEAQAYANRIIPTARGEAAGVVQKAEAYKEQVVKEADGEAQRFLQILETYRSAKSVTRRRLYLEAMRSVLSDANKFILDQGEGGGATQGVVPYLPLNEIINKAAQPSAGAKDQSR